MRVLLTHSYFLRFDPKQWRQMQPYAPLGTLYAAAMLRANGIDVKVHDVMFLENPESIKDVLASYKPDMLVIYDDGFNYLTKMCLTNMREAAFSMSKMAKEAGCVVAVSSSDATDHYAEYLFKGADYIILGEGEQTLLELATAVNAQQADMSGVAGLVYLEESRVVKTIARKVHTELDELPTPAWDLVDMNQYKQAWLGSTGYFSINMGTTRGCPYKCNWCAKPIYGNRYNARSPQHVVKELVALKQQYGFDHVWFCDDIFGLKPGWTKQFAALLKENGLKLRFKIQSRADLLLKDEQIEPLAEAGCETVWMGAESGSQTILDAMDKGITIEQIADATRQLKRHNIHVAFFLQFGYLGETKQDIKSTLLMIQRLMPDEIGVSVSYPLPGTKFYDMVSTQLTEKANWTDSDELALMFRNTYEPSFYKQLHKYVHSYFRTLRAIQRIKNGVRQPFVATTNTIKTMAKLPYYILQEHWQKIVLSKS
jgi:anaerobic magnesium-protoporphyrin IX monomethyl ester cyclase